MNVVSFPYVFIDLTHTLTQKIPTWNMSCGFESFIKVDYDQCDGDTKFRVQGIKMHAGVGTHIDAPAHCVVGGSDVADLPIATLIVPCVVINVTDHTDERYCILPEDIVRFEQKFGKIFAGSMVIFFTGWERFWNQPEKYHNNHIFPSVAPETAKMLLERDIVGIGIDTLSCDRPKDGFAVHQIMLSKGKYLVENIAHAELMPPVGGYCAVLPLKIAGGTESPVRMFGMIKKNV